MSEDQENVLIVGGGFGGLEATLYLRRRLPDAHVTLISDRPEFVFKPYLTYVPFGLPAGDMEFSLPDLAQAQGFQFRRGVAHEVDPDDKALHVSGEKHPYDALFLATGATAGPEEVPGLRDHAHTLGREDDMNQLRHEFRRLCGDVKSGIERRVVLLVPPRCQWAGALYELAFMLSTWLDWKDAREGVNLLLLTAESRFMETFGADVHKMLQRELSKREIGARRHQHPSRIEEDAVVFQESGRLPFDLLVAAPSYVAGARWDALPTDEHGFLRTETASRQVEGYPNVYAVGDASDHPVKQGFLALLQADAAAEHWAARQLDEKPGFSFESQSNWLMEQFDQALFAQGKLEEDALPFEEHAQVERLPVGQLRRIMVSEHLPDRGAGAVNPLYAGLLWKGTEMGLKMLKHLTKREST